MPRQLSIYIGKELADQSDDGFAVVLSCKGALGLLELGKVRGVGQQRL
jgi:hypothetical protein